MYLIAVKNHTKKGIKRVKIWFLRVNNHFFQIKNPTKKVKTNKSESKRLTFMYLYIKKG